MNSNELLKNIDALHMQLLTCYTPTQNEGGEYDNAVDALDVQPDAGDPPEMWDAWRKLSAAIREALDALNVMHDHYYNEVYNIPSPMNMEAIFGAPPRDTDA